MTGEPFDRADSANPESLGDRLDDLLIRAEDRLARSRVGIVAGLAVALAAAAAWWALATPGSGAPVEDSIPFAGSTSLPTPALPGSNPSGPDPEAIAPGAESPPTPIDGEAPQDEEEDEVVVHVIGAVGRPGLVTLGPGDRISDAVDAAGGARTDADLERLNLATPLVDGMQIRVPVTDEEPDDAEDRPLVQLPATAGTTSGPGTSGETGGGATTEPVDLNRAAEAELQRLPGIGPALAGRIVAWRTENGGFTSVDELEAVPGIGPATMADLRDLVVV